MNKGDLMHIIICTVVSMVMMLIMWLLLSPLAAAITSSILCSLALGVGKEFGDSVNPNNKWDWKDFGRDLLGAVIGTSVGLLPWIMGE